VIGLENLVSTSSTTPKRCSWLILSCSRPRSSGTGPRSRSATAPKSGTVSRYPWYGSPYRVGRDSVGTLPVLPGTGAT
jgi:hypothetical protein